MTNTYAHSVGHASKVIEGLEVGANNDGGVNITLEETLDGGEHFTSKDDN